MNEMINLLLPAKINLFLKINGKRADGYHELITRMVMISCFDKLHLEKDNHCLEDPSSAIHFQVMGRVIDGDPSSNLTVRAARMVLDRYPLGRVPRISIVLEKNIPVGAGLGGGSSNAAGALFGVNQLMGSRLTLDELTEMASYLGSDVPFFLGGAHALGWGRGEKIIPLPPEESKVVLLWNPGFSLSTALVYSSLSVGAAKELTESTAVSKIEGLLLQDDYLNDLEPIALKLHPGLSTVKECLYELGAKKAMMSGSGPTIFGIFSDKAMAEKACKHLQENFGGWSDVFKTLESSPLF